LINRDAIASDCGRDSTAPSPASVQDLAEQLEFKRLLLILRQARKACCGIHESLRIAFGHKIGV